MVASALQQEIALIRSGDKQNAKRLLAEIIKADPKNETAWLWMSSVLDSNDQRRHCLEQVLVINPDNQLTELPPEISHLTKLGTLTIHYNSLKELPPEIERLPNITIITEGYPPVCPDFR